MIVAWGVVKWELGGRLLRASWWIVGVGHLGWVIWSHHVGCIVWGSQGRRLTGHKDRVDSGIHLRDGVGPYIFPHSSGTGTNGATGRREHAG